MLTILDGSTFCLSEDDGVIEAGTTGLFADDTRFLSRFEVLLDGRRPLLLGSARVEYYNAAHYLRNAATDGVPRDTVSLARERFVGRGLAERLIVRNEGAAAARYPVSVVLEADFVDVITLKAHQFAVEAGEPAPSLPEPQRPQQLSPRVLFLDDPESELVTWIVGSRDLQLSGPSLEFQLDLASGEEWELVLEVIPGHNDEPRGTSGATLRFGRERRQVRRSATALGLSVPRLEASERLVEDVYHRSVSDLASLRLRGFVGEGDLPAAGMPWFMTVFGRDTLITSLQTQLFGPDLSVGALRSLAALQATSDDPGADAEPGKIPHEVRRGKAAATWFPIYYGTVDATPLFLVLLSEVWRWTGDDALVHELRDPALRALRWIDEFGDRDGDGFVEYERRTPRGLENQSWKDSGDSQRFSDGRIARPPIAPVEVQGYVYDAKRRLAEMARDVWGDRVLCDRLLAEADLLAARFEKSFWMEERGAYALALDGDKQQVDAVCSNIGHLLWSGIVPERRRQQVADLLTSSAMWSGWGLRTMSADEVAYNPISYHNGTVWPHDTSLAAWGLSESGMLPEARLLCTGIFDAAESFAGSLPEVFAGFDRSRTPFAVSYPTASRPQAWAAAAPILCLQLLLGLRVDRAANRLVTVAPDVPHWMGKLTLAGIRARGRHWTVTVDDGVVGVSEAG